MSKCYGENRYNLSQQRALSHGSVSIVSNRPLPNALPSRSADGCGAQASDYVAKVSKTRAAPEDASAEDALDSRTRELISVIRRLDLAEAQQARRSLM